ncbi:MAG: hypothetical protein HPM95_19820 [Alphaproteobacteria bacterium]|nr:hypothetical protein [Alphaproteobacteria bacterium]
MVIAVSSSPASGLPDASNAFHQLLDAIADHLAQSSTFSAANPSATSTVLMASAMSGTLIDEGAIEIEKQGARPEAWLGSGASLDKRHPSMVQGENEMEHAAGDGSENRLPVDAAPKHSCFIAEACRAQLTQDEPEPRAQDARRKGGRRRGAISTPKHRRLLDDMHKVCERFALMPFRYASFMAVSRSEGLGPIVLRNALASRVLRADGKRIHIEERRRQRAFAARRRCRSGV